MVFGANWSSGAAGRFVGCKVIEGILSRKPLGLGGRDEGTVAADKRELVGSQNLAVAQSDRQLHGIISFERMETQMVPGMPF